MSHSAVDCISSRIRISGISSAEAPAKGGVLEVAGKVARAALVALIALVGNVCTLCIPLICRLVSDHHQTEIKEEIEKKQLEHLFKVELGSYSDSDTTAVPQDFQQKVLSLKGALSKLQEKMKQGEQIKVGTVENLYGQFQTLASCDKFITTYQQLKGEMHPLAQYLNNLAEAFYSAPVDGLLIEHAEKKFGSLTIDGSIKQIGDVLKKRQDELCFRRDSKISKLFWAITHPKEVYHSWESQERPDLYNSRESNPMYVVQKLTFNEREIQLIAGPTPYNDPVYRHIFLKGAHELRFNILDRSKKHEKPMIETMEEIADQSNGNLNHVLFGFVTKQKQGYLKPKDLDSLVNQYEQVLKESRGTRGESGISLPTDLTDDEIQEVCERAKTLQRDNWSKEEARHAVIVAIDTMLALKILKKHIEKVPEGSPVYVATACKQCFDRGPVYLAALMLFLRPQKVLSQDEFYRIAGLPLFRSPLNEGREQLRKKFAVFYELTQMLDSAPILFSSKTEQLQT